MRFYAVPLTFSEGDGGVSYAADIPAGFHCTGTPLPNGFLVASYDPLPGGRELTTAEADAIAESVGITRDDLAKWRLGPNPE